MRRASSHTLDLPEFTFARLHGVMRPLADARQTGRWLKGLAPLLALKGELAACASAPRLGATPAIAAKIALLGYFLLDHVVWLSVDRNTGCSPPPLIAPRPARP